MGENSLVDSKSYIVECSREDFGSDDLTLDRSSL